jgi:hypothetical protein
MRIKDQLDLEKKAISRTLEKQSKMLERFMENEGVLKAQLVRISMSCFSGLDCLNNSLIGQSNEGTISA